VGGPLSTLKDREINTVGAMISFLIQKGNPGDATLFNWGENGVRVSKRKGEQSSAIEGIR